MYFRYYRIQDPTTKTVFAVSFLRGQAQHYVKPLLTEFLDDNTNSKSIFRDYKRFKIYLKEVFGISNEKNAVVRII